MRQSRPERVYQLLEPELAAISGAVPELTIGDDLYFRKVPAEKSPVSREEPGAANLRVRADQEVRDEARAGAAAPSIIEPVSSRDFGTVTVERIELNAGIRERAMQRFDIFEERSYLRPDYRTSDERSHIASHAERR